MDTAATQSLARAGVSLAPLEDFSQTDPRLVFFDILTPEVFEFVASSSCGGLVRVIAIPKSTELLAKDRVWELLNAGASDVLAWDSVPNPAAIVAARLAKWDTIDRLVRSPLVQENLVGMSSAWILTLRRIVEMARFSDAHVLLAGESGTGKELTARLLHTLDERVPKRDLIVLDCTTVVPELAGSEFFGHERGAFTGAVAARDGAFALADQGTLFLDEVGDLPRGLQAQLLRVIQEQTYKRVGGNTWHKTQFRLVCATNKDLREAVGRGEFRNDLYYRMATCTLRLPSLRERVEDILPLARHFMKQLVTAGELPELDPAVRDCLLTREYPGNVRDLRQLVTRIMHRHVRPGPITVGDIPEEDRPPVGCATRSWHDGPFEQGIRHAVATDVGLKEIGRIAQDTAVRIAVADEEGNLQRAAQKLKVTDRALQLRTANGRSTKDRLDVELK